MKFFHAIWRWFSPKVAYLDRTPVILNQDGHVTDDALEQSLRRFSILGKRYYHETVQSLPIADIKEIRAAVAMDPTAYAPFVTDLFFMRRLGRRQGRTLVNLWFVRPEAIEKFGLDHAWMIIPESALWSLRRDQRPRLDIINRDEGQLMIHVESTAGVRSMLAADSDEAAEIFRRSLGLEGCQCPVKRITSPKVYLELLLSCLKDASITELTPFIQWKIDPSRLFTPAIRRAGLVITAMVLVYLMLWLGLPLWTKRQLALENERLTERLSAALGQQDRITAIKKEIRMLAQPAETAIPKVPVLDMLHDTLAPQAIITRLTIAANRVEIQGVSEKASTMISTLTKVPGFMQVQLTTPLRKDRKSGKDRFAISFLVQKKLFYH